MTAGEIEKINITPDGGVQKQILKEGTGDSTPENGCNVSLHYTGKLTDGTIFDSSLDRGEPFEFTLGTRSVIQAFDLGVITMKLGEKCNLICAPEYAYGESGSPPSIPPNATLIFELEMLGWKGADVSPNKDGSIERFTIVSSDKRRSPNDGSLCKAHITGKYDGKVFDEREVEFNLGEGSDLGLIEGVEIAIEKMVVGEESRFKIKSRYAFGTKGNEQFNIPPNADVEYIIKLIDCEKGLEDWKFTPEERLTHSKIYKEKGTKYFKKENYSLALKMYKKCVDVLDSNSDEESHKLKAAAYSNQALCYQKTNDHFEAKQACNETLKLEPNNIKALYRRGQCNVTVAEYDEALLDFQKVLELEPTNKAAQNQIQICKHKIKEAKDKEKKIYANMFSKLAAADKEDTPPENDVLAKCGEWRDENAKSDKSGDEWTDEDTKREADFALERDNIVMI
ncbi:FK506-binding protein 59 isoform X2 [Stomoxys calcitrans]|uniref:FK506-binding protein 59 isoform X2 n=1 Tax=Stomoxys calcitrans TaxID=35570 RepID=UPI0027E28001|nr:FK506-binding protein 59 isoform X2 [Stomoxys calcitrans]